ncbi:3-hydroxyacyl-CoA dehydrogenase family protein [Leifsonia sp. AG29]|uniref:3-hydroxyacyl-CoA dehydrogenase family protein n=1 Tax=Leifsonia sp. AG29 TaxID=2598860 RepID=UPI00131E74A4|nr:3-hydroxyacyl-CoA dehydrogenase family protein [Leifsonia sp. AG29]
MSFTLPTHVDTRPLAVIGGGTLGRRIALMLALHGADVRVYDTARATADTAAAFVQAARPDLAAALGGTTNGALTASTDLRTALDNAWLVIEAVPEKLALKKQVFADLDRHAAPDAILASNSSSFPTSAFRDSVADPARLLNTHFYMPPQARSVELMSSGATADAVIELVSAEFSRYHLLPHIVRKESTGFIFNRIWAAIKREALSVVADGIADPADVDALFADLFRAELTPFRFMDQVGLDVVRDIEDHYAAIAGRENTLAPFLRSYIEQGRLGVKTGRGIYDDYA